MMIDNTVLVAAIGSLAPTLAVMVTWRRQRSHLMEIHAIVNSRLTVALATIVNLEAEIRGLRAELQTRKEL